MTMKKMLFTAHWTPEEVNTILNFLEGLQSMIETNYAAELENFYQEITQYANSNHHEGYDFIDDEIPF